jgi:hypothetical protein
MVSILKHMVLDFLETVSSVAQTPVFWHDPRRPPGNESAVP